MDESNKKKKIREKQPSEQRQSYYKNLRKAQKKKREKRNKRLQEVERHDSTKRDATIEPRTLKEKKRSLDYSEKHLTRGKKMVALSAKRQKREEQNKKEGLQESAKKKYQRARLKRTSSVRH